MYTSISKEFNIKACIIDTALPMKLLDRRALDMTYDLRAADRTASLFKDTPYTNYNTGIYSLIPGVGVQLRSTIRCTHI